MDDNQQPQNVNQSEVTSPPSNPFQTPAPKKPKKKLLFILIPLVILLLGGGVAAYLLWPKDQNNSTTVQPENNDTQETVDNAKVIIDDLRQEVSSQLESDYPNINSTVYDKIAPAYQVEGYDYRFSGEFGYGSSYMLDGDGDDSTFNQDVSKIVRTIFIKHELAVVEDTSEFKTLEEYQNDKVICAMTIDAIPIYINCANKSDYDAHIASTKPFADAYFASTEEGASSDLVLRKPVIKDSVNQGYQTAQISIGSYHGAGGFAGLFYKVGDTNWQFFKGAQSSLPCEDYDTNDLRQAYEGEACFDAETMQESTVKP